MKDKNGVEIKVGDIVWVCYASDSQAYRFLGKIIYTCHVAGRCDYVFVNDYQCRHDTDSLTKATDTEAFLWKLEN